eukprot:EG_transcript_3142
MAATAPFLVCGRCEQRLPAETLAGPLYHGMYIAMGATCAACGGGDCQVSVKHCMLSDAALVVLFDLAWRSERAFHTVYDIVAGLQQGWTQFFTQEWPAHKNLTISVTNCITGSSELFQRHSKVSLWAVRSPTRHFALYGEDAAGRARLQGLEAEAAAEGPAAVERLMAQRLLRKAQLETRQQKRQRTECCPHSDCPSTPAPHKGEVVGPPQPEGLPVELATVEDPSARQPADFVRQDDGNDAEGERATILHGCPETKSLSTSELLCLARAALAADRARWRRERDEARAAQQETAARLAAVEGRLAQLEQWLEERADTQQQLAATQRQLAEITAQLATSVEQLNETRARLAEIECLLKQEIEWQRATEEKLPEDTTGTGRQKVNHFMSIKREVFLHADEVKPVQWDSTLSPLLDDGVRKAEAAGPRDTSPMKADEGFAAHEAECVGPRPRTRRAVATLGLSVHSDTRRRVFSIAMVGRQDRRLHHIYGKFFTSDLVQALTRKVGTHMAWDFTSAPSLGVYEEVAGERAKTLVSATTVRVHRLPESNARFLEVVVFATERTYQRRGIGCLLMTAVKDVARLEGCDLILVRAHDDAGVLAFWESPSVGFRRCNSEDLRSSLPNFAAWCRQHCLVLDDTVALYLSVPQVPAEFLVSHLPFPATLSVNITATTGLQRVVHVPPVPECPCPAPPSSRPW